MLPKRNVYVSKYSMQRKKKKEITSSELFLERTLGFTLDKATAFGLCARDHLIAYPSGCVVTLFDYERGKQDGFLIAPLVIDNTNKNEISNNKNLSSSSLNLNNIGGNNPIIPKTISCLCFSSNGPFLAVGEVGHNPRVIVWNYKTKEVLAELRDHKFGIQALVFSPLNPYNLISIGNQNDGFINVWDWKSKKIEACNRITSKVSSVAFSPDGNFFVTVGLRHVKFWSIRTKNNRKVLEGQAAQLTQHRDKNFVDVICQVNPNNGLVRTYVLSDNCTLIWFEKDNTWEGFVHLKANYAYSLSASNNLIVVGCSNGIVRFYDPQKNAIVFTAPRPHPLGIDISVNNGTSYTSASKTNDVYPCTIALSIDPENSILACIYSDRSLYIWNTEDFEVPKKRASFLYHSDSIWGVEVYPLALSGMSITQRGIITKQSNNKPIFPPNTFFTYSSDGTVRFWNLDHMTHSQNFATFVTSPTRKSSIAGIDSDSPISISPLPQQSDNIKKSIYTRQALKILYVDPEYIKMLKSETRGMDNTTCGVKSACVSGDGRYLATGDRLGNIRIYDLEDEYKNIIYAEVHNSEVLSLDFSIPSFDESKENQKLYLVSSSRDRLIHVFELKEKLKFLTSLDDHSASITTVRFSNKENKVISCSADKSMIFRNKEENKNPNNNNIAINYSKYNTISVRSTIYDFDVDSNTDKVISVSQDKKISEYDIKSGKMTTSWQCSDPPNNEYNIINNNAIDSGLIKIALDPSGKYAAICSMDKCIRILDLEKKICISRGFGHSELITGVHFTLDGKRLISTSTDGCIFVWKLDPIIVKDIKARLSKKVGIVWPSSLMSEDCPKTPVKIKFDVNYDELPRWAKEQIDREELNQNENIVDLKNNKSNSTIDSEINEKNNRNNVISNKSNNSNNCYTINQNSNNNNTNKNDGNNSDINKYNSIMDNNDNDDIIIPRKKGFKEQPLIKGVWEKRISPEGIQLHTDFPNIKPIAKLVDRKTRRYSIETITFINSQNPLSFPVPLKSDLIDLSKNGNNNQNLVIEEEDEEEEDDDDSESSQSDDEVVVDKNELEAVRVSDEVLPVTKSTITNDRSINRSHGSSSSLLERRSKTKSASQVNLRIDTSLNGLNKGEYHSSLLDLKNNGNSNGSLSKLNNGNSNGSLSRLSATSNNKLNENTDRNNLDKDKDDSTSNLVTAPPPAIPRVNYDNITFEEYLNQPLAPTPMRLSITSRFWESRSPNPLGNTSIINMARRTRGVPLNVETLLASEGFGFEEDTDDDEIIEFPKMEDNPFYKDYKKENEEKTNKELKYKRLLMAQEIEKTRIRLSSISNDGDSTSPSKIPKPIHNNSKPSSPLLNRIQGNDSSPNIPNSTTNNSNRNSINNNNNNNASNNNGYNNNNNNNNDNINNKTNTSAKYSNSNKLNTNNENITNNSKSKNSTSKNINNHSYSFSISNNKNNINIINHSRSDSNTFHGHSSNNNSNNSNNHNNHNRSNSNTNHSRNNSNNSTGNKNVSISHNNSLVMHENTNNNNNGNNNNNNNSNYYTKKALANNKDNYEGGNIYKSINITNKLVYSISHEEDASSCSNNEKKDNKEIDRMNTQTDKNQKMEISNSHNLVSNSTKHSRSSSNDKKLLNDKRPMIDKKSSSNDTKPVNNIRSSSTSSSHKRKEIDDKKIYSQLQMIQNLTDDLTETLRYLQSDERKSTIDENRRNQDKQLIKDISRTINSLMTKVGKSLNLTSINDVKPYIEMINNALHQAN